MLTYILLKISDEGIQERRVTKADSVEAAIEAFDFYPFSPTDFLQGADEGTREAWERKDEDVVEWVLEQIRDRAVLFYNIGCDPVWDGRRQGNYTGDSSSLHVIIEVGEEGACFYPGPGYTYKPETVGLIKKWGNKRERGDKV